MTLEQLRILIQVVQAGSFTQAAARLGTQKSYVSRVIAQLEAELGAKLIERTTRRLAVTELGREVHERAVGILAAVDDTARIAQQAQGAPRGTLRLTCGVEFGMLAVGRWVEAFLAAHPGTTAEVEYTSRVLDLVHEGFDLAVRVGTVPPSRLVARPLGQIDYALFACPRYLDARGRPATPDALREHALVMFDTAGPRRAWRLLPTGGSERDAVTIDGPARLRVNNAFGVRDALLASLGIGPLPLLIAAEPVEAGRLVPVLPDWRPASVPVHAVYPSNRYLSAKVRAFIDLALARFPSDGATALEVTARACAAAAAPRRRRARALPS